MDGLSRSKGQTKRPESYVVIPVAPGSSSNTMPTTSLSVLYERSHLCSTGAVVTRFEYSNRPIKELFLALQTRSKLTSAHISNPSNPSSANAHPRYIYSPRSKYIQCATPTLSARRRPAPARAVADAMSTVRVTAASRSVLASCPCEVAK